MLCAFETVVAVKVAETDVAVACVVGLPAAIAPPTTARAATTSSAREIKRFLDIGNSPLEWWALSAETFPRAREFTPGGGKVRVKRS
jgi:hypothetical protein